MRLRESSDGELKRERERSNDDEIEVRSKAPSKQRWSDLVTVVVVSGWVGRMV